MNKNQIKVAVTEDHAMVRAGLVSILSSMPEFRVVLEAANGKELLNKLKATKLQPDIVTLDINMPVMNGYQTMPLLKRNYPRLKVVALSIYDSEFSIIRMYRLGVSGYLEKGRDPQELKRALLAVNSGDFYHDDEISGRIIFRLMNGLPLNEINSREQKFLSLCCSELTYKEIGEQMHASERTIHGYRDALFNKLDINTRTGLVIFALRSGLVPQNDI